MIKSTKFFNPDAMEKAWYSIDATGLCIGRLAAHVAILLKGKDKAYYTPNTDCGSYVVITNCEKIEMTASKKYKKSLYWHTGYAGGIKSQTVASLLDGKNPSIVLKRAISGMFPAHSPHANAQLAKLFIYAGSEHRHAAQNPKPLDFGSMSKKNKVAS